MLKVLLKLISLWILSILASFIIYIYQKNLIYSLIGMLPCFIYTYYLLFKFLLPKFVVPKMCTVPPTKEPPWEVDYLYISKGYISERGLVCALHTLEKEGCIKIEDGKVILIKEYQGTDEYLKQLYIILSKNSENNIFKFSEIYKNFKEKVLKIFRKYKDTLLFFWSCKS